jgi:hypothetical protein
MAFRIYQYPSKNIVGLACILATSLLLSACQTPPKAAEPPPSAETAAVDDANSATLPAVEETPVVEEPAPVLTCPEPEPAPACPPPPKPKPCPVCPAAKLDGKMVVGDVEKVKLDPPGITYKARIDTGAEGTSIHAVNIVRFERDGQKWVRFDIENPGGKAITLEREVVRRVKVRQVDASDFGHRLVVIMTVTIGSFSEQVEVALNDRSEMEYPALIGRNLLRNNIIVDVSQEFIAK